MKKIMVFGDSNSWGLNPVDGSRYENRWPKVMAKALKDEYEVVEENISGRTTMWDDYYVSCRNGKDGLLYALASQTPLDMIIFALGVNDLKYTDPIGSYKGMEELVRIAKNADAIIPLPQNYPNYPNGLKILLLSEVHLHSQLQKIKPLSSIRNKYPESTEYAKYYKAIADRQCVDYMDLAEVVSTPSEVDGIHLTEDQHIIIGLAVAEKVKRIYSKE